MSDPSTRGPETVCLASLDGRLVVQFQWHTDRFVQKIYIDGQSAGQSIDGDGQTDWPPSPPLQQLSLEPIDDQLVVLGVGAAGRGHWSISAQPDGPSALKFELACRSKDQPAYLGSAYKLAGTVDLQSVGPTAINRDEDRITAGPSTSTGSPTHQWTYKLSPADPQA